MRRRLYFFGVGLLALVSACENVSTDSDLSGDSNVPDALAISRSIPPIFANGIDQVTVFATVVDGQARGLADVGVVFATDRGSIEPFATTDADGVAASVLTSEAGVEDITATITAEASTDTSGSALPYEAVLLVSREPLDETLIAEALRQRKNEKLPGIESGAGSGNVMDTAEALMLGVTLTVRADPPVIPADGASASGIRAALVATTSRVPLEGETIFFGASAGAITGQVQTDATGTAIASLTGTQSGTESQITAFYGDLLTASTSVTFSPLTLELLREATVIDGNETTTPVLAVLTNALGNPVAGASIRFATDAGTINSPVVTDSRGIARVELFAPVGIARATVDAEFGALRETLVVSFEPLPEAAEVLLAVSPQTLPADGAGQATLTATLLDADGNPVPDGTIVTFSVEAGTGSVVGPERTTNDGEASALYISGTEAGFVTLGAMSGSAGATVLLTLTRLAVGGISLATSETSILADGLAATEITATVRDLLGNPVAPGTSVQFSATLGEIVDVQPTNASGVATARLRSAQRTGLSRVTASVGGFTETIDVRFVSEAAAQIVAVAVNPPRIGIRGSGVAETSTFTFEVRDRNGIPVDEDHAVTLNFTIVPVSGEVDATVAPASAVTNEQGRALAHVRSGILAGVVEVSAGAGSLISEPIRVAIHGDQPDPDHFSLSFERVNIEGLVFDGIRNGVTARVGDQYGNPVPNGTAVWFEAEFGLVQGSAFTDEHAEATVWEITAAPRPTIPNGDGLVTITAQTVSKAGDRITTSGRVMWSGPTIVEVTSPSPGFALDNGESITITYRVRDANFNPLTGGTNISVTATTGTLGGDVDITLPDTQSSEYTTFSVVLSDDDALEIETRAVSVTVNVTSKNGNRSASITGTMN